MAKISDLVKVISPTDGNVLPISDGLTTKKISFLDLKTSINTVATSTQLGTIKIGNGLLIDDTGRVSVRDYDEFSLPAATNSQLGGVIIGSGLTVNESGVLTSAYTLPTATPTVLGGIKVGEGLTISNGILSTIPISVDAFDDSGITIGNQSDFSFYIENSNTPTIKDEVNGVIVLSVRDTSMAGNLADIRLLSRSKTTGLGDETAPALVPDFSGQPMNLGAPSLKWSKIYANNFIGNVTGTAEKSTQSDTLLVGSSYFPASTSAIANTIMVRDSIGNINANNFTGNVTGNVTGNATTATQLQTSRLINGEPFNGTQDITILSANPFALTRGSYITGGSATYNGSAASTWNINATPTATANTVVARDTNGDFLASTITASNFIGSVTGNVTGSLFGLADRTSRLDVARKINGIDFDGTQDIQLPSSAAKVDELAGSIKMWGSATPPSNWLLCNGQSVSKNTYPTLFSRIGYTFGGIGDFFNLPNLINRFPIGAGELYTANSTGGNKDQIVVGHQHTATAQSIFTGNVLPNHSHQMSGSTNSAGSHAHAGVLQVASNPDGRRVTSNRAVGRNADDATGGNLGTTTTVAGLHSHTIDATINSASSGVPSGTVNTLVAISTVGASGTNANLPPYIGIYYIIKVSDDGSGGGTLQAGTGIDIQTSGSYTIITATGGGGGGAFVPTSGGTMTGYLTLNASPTSSLHAATKSYVDSQDNIVLSTVNTKLPLAGGALTGPVYLHAKPAAALQAATKNYVDDQISSITSNRVSQIKTFVWGAGKNRSDDKWNSLTNEFSQEILSTTPQAVGRNGKYFQISIRPTYSNSKIMVVLDLTVNAPYVSWFQLKRSINGGAFVNTVDTTAYGVSANGVQDCNVVTYLQGSVSPDFMQRVHFTFADPDNLNTDDTYTYRLYACSKWSNTAYRLMFNNRYTYNDMPNYSTIYAMEYGS